jgi:hypothetical protein
LQAGTSAKEAWFANRSQTKRRLENKVEISIRREKTKPATTKNKK